MASLRTITWKNVNAPDPTASNKLRAQGARQLSQGVGDFIGTAKSVYEEGIRDNDAAVAAEIAALGTQEQYAGAADQFTEQAIKDRFSGFVTPGAGVKAYGARDEAIFGEQKQARERKLYEEGLVANKFLTVGQQQQREKQMAQNAEGRYGFLGDAGVKFDANNRPIYDAQIALGPTATQSEQDAYNLQVQTGVAAAKEAGGDIYGLDDAKANIEKIISEGNFEPETIKRLRESGVSNYEQAFNLTEGETAQIDAGMRPFNEKLKYDQGVRNKLLTDWKTNNATRLKSARDGNNSSLSDFRTSLQKGIYSETETPFMGIGDTYAGPELMKEVMNELTKPGGKYNTGMISGNDLTQALESMGEDTHWGRDSGADLYGVLDRANSIATQRGGVLQELQRMENKNMTEDFVADAGKRGKRQEILGTIQRSGGTYDPRAAYQYQVGQLDKGIQSQPPTARPTTPGGGIGGEGPAIDLNNIRDRLGAVSAQLESGAGGVGTISTGEDDVGGKSYGTYQISTNAGTMERYLKGSKFKEDFDGLKEGSPAFDAKWKSLANNPEFGEEQYQFIRDTHYQPQIDMLNRNGIDLSGKGRAVQEAVWSTGTQLGGGSKRILKALEGKDIANMSDADVVNAIYDSKLANVDTDFKSSSANAKSKQRNRIEREREALLQLSNETGTPEDVDTLPNAEVPKVEGVLKEAAINPDVPTSADDAPVPIEDQLSRVDRLIKGIDQQTPPSEKANPELDAAREEYATWKKWEDAEPTKGTFQWYDWEAKRPSGKKPENPDSLFPRIGRGISDYIDDKAARDKAVFRKLHLTAKKEERQEKDLLSKQRKKYKSAIKARKERYDNRPKITKRDPDYTKKMKAWTKKYPPVALTWNPDSFADRNLNMR